MILHRRHTLGLVVQEPGLLLLPFLGMSPRPHVVVDLRIPFVLEVLVFLQMAQWPASYLAGARRRDGSGRCGQKLDGGEQGVHDVAKTPIGWLL